MFFVLADANTSAGAPWLICIARPELGPKLNTTLVPGCAASNRWPSFVKASFNEAAANTVTVPEMLDVEAVADVEELAPAVPVDVEHPTSSTPAAARHPALKTVRRILCSLDWHPVGGSDARRLATSLP